MACPDFVAAPIESEPPVEALSLTEEELRAHVSAVSDVVLVMDAEGRYLKIAKTDPALLYKPARELLGKSLHEIISPAQADAFLGYIRQALATRQTVQVEYSLPIGDDLKWFAGAVSPLPGGKVVWVAREVTAHKRAENIIRFLTEASSVLASSLDVETTLSVLARLAVPRLADWFFVDLLEATGKVRRVKVAHADPRLTPLARAADPYTPDPTSDSPYARVLRDGNSVLITDPSEKTLERMARDEAHLRWVRALNPRSMMIVPLSARGRTLGLLTFVKTQSRRPYDPVDLDLIEELARRAALAVDSADLYRQARDAEARTRCHAERMRALAEASRVFAEASPTYKGVLDTITRHTAECIGDASTLSLISPDGQWHQPVSAWHPDPEARTLMLELYAASPRRIDEGVVAQVLQTGQPLRTPDEMPEDLRRRLKPEYLPYFDRFGVYSTLIVPLRVRSEAIGTLALFRHRTGRPYTPDDQVLLQDLADRAALAIDNARLYQEAQDAVRAREQFLAMASHELRTPMTVLQGYHEVLTSVLKRELASNPTPPGASNDRAMLERVLEKMDRAIARLTRLVDELLDVSRLLKDRLSITPERTNLTALLDGVVEGIRIKQQSGQYGDQGRVQIEQAIATSVWGSWDPARLEQVLVNLLDNAIKYSPPEGKILLALTVEDHKSDTGTGAWAHLAVHDEGLGVPPEEQARIFEPFARATNVIERHVPGLGMGLAITKQIVERQGGQIWIERGQGGRGSVFHVLLPGVEAA